MLSWLVLQKPGLMKLFGDGGGGGGVISLSFALQDFLYSSRQGLRCGVAVPTIVASPSPGALSCALLGL